MQVKVPYITIETLDRVLASLVASTVITEEQSAIISGEAKISVRTLIRKDKEEKQARNMRQQCYSIARKEAAATRSSIDRSMKYNTDSLGVELSDERRLTEAAIADIRQYRDIDLLRLQLEIDVLDHDRLSLDRESEAYADNIAKDRELARRRTQVKAKAAADIEETRKKGHEALKNIHAAYAESQAALSRRMTAATDAYELTRSIIENAADEDLPGILAELQGREGGER